MGATKPSTEKIDKLTPEAMANLKQLNEATGGMMDEMMANLGFDITGQQPYQQGQEALGQQLAAFDPAATASTFDQYVADPARTAFQEQVIPGIAERYSGRGSASQVAMGGAAGDLERNLAAQKSQTMLSSEQQKEAIRNQAIQQALQFASAPGQQGLSSLDRYMGMMGQGMTNPYEIVQHAGDPGLAPALIGMAGSVLGGPIGGMIGQGMGGLFGGGGGAAAQTVPSRGPDTAGMSRFNQSMYDGPVGRFGR